MPTLWLGYFYLPRSIEQRTIHNPGIDRGGAVGIVLLALYIAAILATSGFHFYSGRRSFGIKYLVPAIAFAAIIFPRYAIRSSRHYLLYVDNEMFWLPR